MVFFLFLFLNFKKEKNMISDKIRYLTMTDASKVWMPDTFFRSSFSHFSHKLMAQPILKKTYWQSNRSGMRKQEDSTKYSLRTFTSVFSQMETSSIGIFPDFPTFEKSHSCQLHIFISVFLQHPCLPCGGLLHASPAVPSRPANLSSQCRKLYGEKLRDYLGFFPNS